MKKFIALLVVCLTILGGVSSFAFCQTTTNPNYVNYIGTGDIIRDNSTLDAAYRSYFTKYMKYTAPNGKDILIVAQDQVTDEQLLKAYNQLSFYLKDHGSYNKTVLANKMADNNALLMMPNGADGASSIPENVLTGQPLYQMETPTVGSNWYIQNDYSHRDASYEEILHMVHDYGIGTQSNPGVYPQLQQQIYTATMNALPANKADWGTSGLWGLDSRDWLLELEQEGSLEQEYLASVVDSYYGLWGPYTENPGGMWGIYVAKTRAEVAQKDSQGYAIVQAFLPEKITYMVRIDAGFSGTFKMHFDGNTPYTHKSRYLLNASLLGSNNSNLTGNDDNNILIGNSGNNTIDGKAGTDVVQFTGASTEYTIVNQNGVKTVTDTLNRDGTDTLIDIEVLRFTDTDIQ